MADEMTNRRLGQIVAVLLTMWCLAWGMIALVFFAGRGLRALWQGMAQIMGGF